jgi:hypothetical protein
MRLARTDAGMALAKARSVSDPWFRAQALSWGARFTDDAVEPIAAEAAQAAAACVDDYGRSAVRAWEIAALAERGHTSSARKALTEAVATARRAQPTASRSEALLLLMEAAFLIDREAARTVSAELRTHPGTCMSRDVCVCVSDKE